MTPTERRRSIEAGLEGWRARSCVGRRVALSQLHDEIARCLDLARRNSWLFGPPMRQLLFAFALAALGICAADAASEGKTMNFEVFVLAEECGSVDNIGLYELVHSQRQRG